MKQSWKYIVILFLFLNNCESYNKNISKKEDDKIYFSSTGFALIYENILYEKKTVNKKINNDDILILHDSLKKNTPVKITNLKNSKYIKTKIYKKAKYPKIFNLVLSKKAASILDLDFENPLVEIIELKKNKTFIAKEGNIFDEEKNVAEKAPVDEITMNDITKKKLELKSKEISDEKFIIIISDFYYKDTAITLKNDLINKISIKNIYVKKINDKKYRLLVGPFKNFNALKTTYISLNNLGFENLNIKN